MRELPRGKLGRRSLATSFVEVLGIVESGDSGRKDGRKEEEADPSVYGSIRFGLIF